MVGVPACICLAICSTRPSQTLAAELETLRADRELRARAIVDRLVQLGAPIGWDDVTAIAGAAPIGRPHIARALVQVGTVPDVPTAFTVDWIGAGGRAYVAKRALEPAAAVRFVVAAGGVPVLAHPGAGKTGKSRVTLDDDRIAALADAGLAGLEVDHPDHDADTRTRLRALAADLGLIVTGSSDDHGTLTGRRIGCETTGVPAVYDAMSRRQPARSRCTDEPRCHAKFFLEAFVTLLVIMDPVGSIPVFLALTGRRPSRERSRLAWQAVVVAGLVITTFALFGQQILRYLGITLAALQAAGGLLLVLVALELLTGRQSKPEETPDVNVALVPLGTPLLAGPGAIVATIVFVRRAHGVADATALATAIASVHLILWFALRFSSVILRVIRGSGVVLLTRISGLLLSAIAVQLIADGARAFAHAG